jgi:hypothetical protein
MDDQKPVIFGFRRRLLLIAMSEGHTKPGTGDLRAPEETPINSHVRRTQKNPEPVIFGLRRRLLLIAMSEGHTKT